MECLVEVVLPSAVAIGRQVPELVEAFLRLVKERLKLPENLTGAHGALDAPDPQRKPLQHLRTVGNRPHIS